MKLHHHPLSDHSHRPRLITVFGAKRDAEEVIGPARALRRNFETHLAGREWLLDQGPTAGEPDASHGAPSRPHPTGPS
jgi:hypothetical protein